MSDALVILQNDGAVARITFNRPDVLNALNTEMADGLLDICKTVAADPNNRAVVVSGNGRAFMAGGDVAEFAGDLRTRTQRIGSLIDKLHLAIEILTELPRPVIACVHGALAGAGMSIALAADLAVAADDTVFNLAYAKLGASPDGSSSWSLPRVVGVRKAMEIAILSENIRANEALRLGLVNRVVAAGDLETEVTLLARRLAEGPTFAFGKIKKLMRTSQERTLHDQLLAERNSFLACNETRDFETGVTAFLKKQKTAFKGE
ncbi:enoyl-CoA hydratase-related protein [Tardiphaga sp. OK245]|uniref:enoyl-CoA hydratase/isomerase family protein n=1 Tax=Tardiphaga sp. OK245 TaxID=1855306 RepID=UPI0008A721BB|nr:enoyl-CoA hydratase-related protein [Tardiphaga sp. OK245]SEH88036.1 2-(1,2-epoxy-1,2-dihydrophenyl)acetyl-CoA isomerase [Tardiphaga sp. OK245]